MNFKKYVKHMKDLVDKALDRYLPSAREYPVSIHRAMRYSVFSGGKRIRPILAMESAMACGGKAEKALPVACAIEFIHTYSLIHDDLPSMDDDDYRRGRLTCHKVFGEANAIMAGDALLTLAFNVISKNLDPKTSTKIITELSDAIGTKGMVGGQVADLEYRSRRKDKVTLNRINHLKTARLFEASAKAGAMIACADLRKVGAMADFGSSLGLAFQIIDDIIDRGDYVKVLGLRTARSDSKKLIEKARHALSGFGDRGHRLEDIAVHILERIK